MGKLGNNPQDYHSINHTCCLCSAFRISETHMEPYTLLTRSVLAHRIGFLPQPRQLPPSLLKPLDHQDDLLKNYSQATALSCFCFIYQIEGWGVGDWKGFFGRGPLYIKFPYNVRQFLLFLLFIVINIM